MSKATQSANSATATWTATPQQVEKLVAAVLPHASSDDYLPMICCVEIEVRDGQLIAAATDRYTIGVAWESLAEWNKDAEVQPNTSVRIYASDLRRALSFLKPKRKDVATWSVGSDGLTVAVKGESLTLRSVDVDFVKWRTFLGTQAEKRGDGVAVMKFTPRLLNAFLASAKALGEHVGAMRWRFGAEPADPTLIEIGDNFIGLLMPQRPDEKLPQLDLAAIGIEATPAVAA